MSTIINNNDNNQQINKILTCSICKKYFKNPVSLPCGANICKEHVVLKQHDQFQPMVQNHDNQPMLYKYQCHLCNQDHVAYEDGFATNIGMVELIKLNWHLDELFFLLLLLVYLHQYRCIV